MVPNDAEPSNETRRLLTAAAGGDENAWRDLVAPSDVLQEAYLEAARHLPDYLRAPTLPFYLWLRSIAGHRLLMLHRRHRSGAGHGTVADPNPTWEIFSFSPDGRYLVRLLKGTAEVFDAATNQSLGGPLKGTFPFARAAVSGDGSRLALAYAESGPAARRFGVLLLPCPPAGPQPLARALDLPHPRPVVPLAFAPEGRHLVSVAGSGHVWDTATGTCTAAFANFGEIGELCAFSPDGSERNVESVASLAPRLLLLEGAQAGAASVVRRSGEGLTRTLDRVGEPA